MLLLRVWFTVVFVVVGLGLEWRNHPQQRLLRLWAMWPMLLQHPALLLASSYGLWVIIASFFSVDPILALSGNVVGAARYSDSALWVALLVLVFILVYLNVLRNPPQTQRLVTGLLIGASLVALAAIFEVVSGKGLHYPLVEEGNLPLFTFPQKGHLAGYFLLTLAVALATKRWALMVLLALALGLTENRAALVAIGFSLLLFLRMGWRPWLIATLLIGLAWLGGTQRPTISNNNSINLSNAQRNLTDTASTQTRLYMWKAAWGGILERPLVGWGGSYLFARHWTEFITFQEAQEFWRLEQGREVISIERSVIGTSFLTRNENGVPVYGVMIYWKAHNLLFDTAIMHGLIGLLLLLGLLAWIGLSWFRGNVLALAVLAYGVYCMLWYPVLEVEGVLWALLGLAAAKALLMQRVKVKA